MEKKETDMTILMMAFDSYNDVWDGFVHCKEKYWSDCRYPMVIVTCEETNVPQGIDKVITTGSGLEWTQRLHKALEQIDSRFVLLMLEDLYIDRKVNSGRIAQCISLMKEHSIGHLRLMPDIKYQRDYEKNDKYGEYTKGHAYRISTHPAIWKKEYLCSLTEKAMDAWNFEYLVSFESNKYPEKCLTCKDKVISFTNTIWRQKWTREGVALCKQEGVTIDFTKRKKHSAWSNLKTDINALIYHIVGADRVTKLIIKQRKKKL